MTFVYDAQNRLVRKDRVGTVNDIDFAYVGWQVIEQYEGGGSNPKRQFVYGNYIGRRCQALPKCLAPGVMDVNNDNDSTCTETEADDRYFYHQNTLFSVYGITDSDGNLIEAYEYDPYGTHTQIDNSGAPIADFTTGRTTLGASDIGNPYMFTGREFMPEIELQLNRNRFYSCEQGRWMSRDPIGYADGQNLYHYVQNPTRSRDPLGLYDDTRTCFSNYLKDYYYTQRNSPLIGNPKDVHDMFEDLFEEIDGGVNVVMSWNPSRFHHVGAEGGSEDPIAGVLWNEDKQRWEGECAGPANMLADEQFSAYINYLKGDEQFPSPLMIELLLIHKWAGPSETITFADHWAVFVNVPHIVMIDACCDDKDNCTKVDNSERVHSWAYMGNGNTTLVLSGLNQGFVVMDPTYGINTVLGSWVSNAIGFFRGWRIHRSLI